MPGMCSARRRCAARIVEPDEGCEPVAHPDLGLGRAVEGLAAPAGVGSAHAASHVDRPWAACRHLGTDDVGEWRELCASLHMVIARPHPRARARA
jgi:hypothetical protein